MSNSMKIGILGSGIVGDVLARGFLKHNYQVMRGSRKVEKLMEWQKRKFTSKDWRLSSNCCLGRYHRSMR